jgi:hypothetical protein
MFVRVRVTRLDRGRTVVYECVDWWTGHDEDCRGYHVGEILSIVGSCEADCEAGYHQERGPGEEGGGSP